MKVVIFICILLFGCAGAENKAGAVFDNANDAIKATTSDPVLWDSGDEEEKPKKRARY